MDIRLTKELLSRYGLRSNKALGQNFLIDEQAQRAIARFAYRSLPVIEIGAGLGALTGALIELGAEVTAVEIDASMAAVLRDRFDSHLTLIEADFLDVDLRQLVDQLGEATVAANLPYYITTPISMRLMREPVFPALALMMQKEAAERFTASPSDRVYGPLSVLSQYYYDIEKLMELPESAYYPQPDVRSVVLGFTRNDNPYLEVLDVLLDRAFAMRRKTLFNNLRKAGYSAERLNVLFERCSLDADIRAERLSVQQFALIAREIARDAE